MAELREFLAELAADAERLGRFIQDPEAVMKEAKLSDKDREALRSGFANVIYARLSGVDLEEAFGMSLRPTQLPQNLFQQVPVQFQPLQIMPQLPPQITLQLPPQYQLPPQFQLPPIYQLPPQITLQLPPQYQLPPQFQLPPQITLQLPPQITLQLPPQYQLPPQFQFVPYGYQQYGWQR